VPITGTWLLPASGRSSLTVGRCDPPARPRPRPAIAVRARSSAVGRFARARSSFSAATEILQASWRECAIVAARFSLRSRARAAEVLWLRSFLKNFLLLLVLAFCWVGEFGLGFGPDEKSKAEEVHLLAFFLSVICCCDTRRPFEEEWSTLVSVLDWY